MELLGDVRKEIEKKISVGVVVKGRVLLTASMGNAQSAISFEP